MAFFIILKEAGGISFSHCFSTYSNCFTAVIVAV